MPKNTKVYYKGGSLYGKGQGEFIDSDNNITFHASRKQTEGKQEGTAVEYKTEFRAVFRDGQERFICTRGKVYHSEGGQPLRLTGVSWDVTEQRQAEENLRETTKRLYRLMKPLCRCS